MKQALKSVSSIKKHFETGKAWSATRKAQMVSILIEEKNRAVDWNVWFYLGLIRSARFEFQTTGLFCNHPWHVHHFRLCHLTLSSLDDILIRLSWQSKDKKIVQLLTISRSIVSPSVWVRSYLFETCLRSISKSLSHYSRSDSSILDHSHIPISLLWIFLMHRNSVGKSKSEDGWYYPVIQLRARKRTEDLQQPETTIIRSSPLLQ